MKKKRDRLYICPKFHFILKKNYYILIFDFLAVASVSFACYVSRGKQLTLFPEKTLRFEGKSLTVFQAEGAAFK